MYPVAAIAPVPAGQTVAARGEEWWQRCAVCVVHCIANGVHGECAQRRKAICHFLPPVDRWGIHTRYRGLPSDNAPPCVSSLHGALALKRQRGGRFPKANASVKEGRSFSTNSCARKRREGGGQKPRGAFCAKRPQNLPCFSPAPSLFNVQPGHRRRGATQWHVYVLSHQTVHTPEKALQTKRK